MRMEVEYPQEVDFVLFHNFLFKMEPQRPRALIVCHYLGTQVSLEAGHPAVFSANGSHGVWAQEGINIFSKIFLGEI